MRDDDDLSQRDLSQIKDEDLTPEERREIRRRMGEFVVSLGQPARPTAKTEAKAKPISRWTPRSIDRPQ